MIRRLVRAMGLTSLGGLVVWAVVAVVAWRVDDATLDPPAAGGWRGTGSALLAAYCAADAVWRAMPASARMNVGEVLSDSMRAKVIPAPRACSRAPMSTSYRISR